MVLMARRVNASVAAGACAGAVMACLRDGWRLHLLVAEGAGLRAGNREDQRRDGLALVEQAQEVANGLAGLDALCQVRGVLDDQDLRAIEELVERRVPALVPEREDED